LSEIKGIDKKRMFRKSVYTTLKLGFVIARLRGGSEVYEVE